MRSAMRPSIRTDRPASGCGLPWPDPPTVRDDLAGEHAATGQSASMQPVLGTSIVRVFEKTAAVTGLTESMARRMQLPAKSVSIVAKHHAGYYPGAELMTLKLVYDPQDGRVLGAQVVGGAGTDKRIDVIATAMHFGGTVRDLAGLDLAYAPPFGSAKDPVHMAAFVACNQLDGIESFCPPDASLKACRWSTCGRPPKLPAQPLAGVESAIAHSRWTNCAIGSASSIRTGRPWSVARSGVRGHIAARILKQHGFRVRNLAGGATVRHRVWTANSE